MGNVNQVLTARLLYNVTCDKKEKYCWSHNDDAYAPLLHHIARGMTAVTQIPHDHPEINNMLSMADWAAWDVPAGAIFYYVDTLSGRIILGANIGPKQNLIAYQEDRARVSIFNPIVVELINDIGLHSTVSGFIHGFVLAYASSWMRSADS